MVKETILINNQTITIERKNIKHMYLRVLPPDGEIKISAPSFYTDKDIIEFIKSREDWILEKQNYIKEKNIKAPLKYINGEKHPLWGEEYTLQLIKSDKFNNAFADSEKKVIYLPVSKRSTIEKRKKKLTEFYRSEMNKAVPPVLEKCIKIVGRKPSEVKIRNMKNWGNCNQNKRITLNLNLAKKEPVCLEYVTIHELCHLIEFNHSKKFKKLMDKFCPNWKKIKKILNE